MSAVFDAAETFFDHLAAVGWTALGVALLLHLLRLAARAFAWRTILAAAYPESRVRWLNVFGSYAAGVGVNSLVPARGGDVLKLVLARRGVEGSAYPTLASTLLVETLFDIVVGGAILVWALTLGVFPSVDVPDLPQVDWYWPLHHPRLALVIGAVWLTVIALLVVIAARRVRAFWQRVRQGFAVLRQPHRYLAQVVSWQAASWLLRAASVYWFLRAFGLPATVHNALLVLAVQSLSTLLPFTPGGIGTQQGFLVFVFRNAPISKTALLSFSVGMHIAVTAFNAILGFVAILVMLRTLRWRRVVVPEEGKVYARHP